LPRVWVFGRISQHYSAFESRSACPIVEITRHKQCMTFTTSSSAGRYNLLGFYRKNAKINAIMAKAAPVCISYLRYSTPEQGRGDSIRRQIAAAEKWAHEHGLTLDRTLKDEGVSAYSGRNLEVGALGSIIRDIEAKRIPKASTLIVESFDRLSRETLNKAMELFLRVVNSGVRLVTLADKKEYSGECSTMDIMYAVMVMGRANEESLTKSKRVREAWDTKRKDAREQKKLVTSRLPFWLEMSNDKVTINKAKADAVRELFRAVAKGSAIGPAAKRLGFPQSNAWFFLRNKSVLGSYQPRKIVKHPRGYQTAVPDGEPVAGYFPPIISQELFAQVQEIFARRAKGTRISARARYVNVFSGRIFSPKGEAYQATLNGKTRALVLYSGKQGKSECVYIPCVFAEVAFLISFLEDRWFLNRSDVSENDVEAVADRLNDVRKQIETLETKAAKESGVDIVAVSKLLTRMMREEKQLAQNIETLLWRRQSVDEQTEMTDRVAALLSGVIEGNLPEDERLQFRALIASSIDRIVIKPVQVAWRLTAVKGIVETNGEKHQWVWAYSVQRHEVWCRTTEGAYLMYRLTEQPELGLYDGEYLPPDIRSAFASLSERNGNEI